MPQKILLVDDEKDLVEMLEKRLKNSGYTVVTAGNGEEGLKALKAEDPNLLVLDISMPVMDGYTMIKELRRIEKYKTLPIMVITGRERLKELLALEGICDYLIKPFDAEELLARIEWNIKSNPDVKGTSASAPAAATAQPGVGKTILLVDDDPDLIQTLKIRLEAQQFNVRIATNGEEALEKVDQQPPDLIIMDVMMPKMDGFSTLKHLNQISNRKVPVIIMTGTKAIPEEEFRIEGARAFFRKPFDTHALLKQINELFS